MKEPLDSDYNEYGNGVVREPATARAAYDADKEVFGDETNAKVRAVDCIHGGGGGAVLMKWPPGIDSISDDVLATRCCPHDCRNCQQWHAFTSYV